VLVLLPSGCGGGKPEPTFVVVCEFKAGARGPAPDRAALLGRAGFEGRYALGQGQADLLARVAARGGSMRGFEVNLFLAEFDEPALVEALQQGPLRVRVERNLLERARQGSTAGSEVLLRIGPPSNFEQLDVSSVD
jgi:hypothetical protein